MSFSDWVWNWEFRDGYDIVSDLKESTFCFCVL